MNKLRYREIQHDPARKQQSWNSNQGVLALPCSFPQASSPGVRVHMALPGRAGESCTDLTSQLASASTSCSLKLLCNWLFLPFKSPVSPHSMQHKAPDRWSGHSQPFWAPGLCTISIPPAPPLAKLLPQNRSGLTP